MGNQNGRNTEKLPYTLEEQNILDQSYKALNSGTGGALTCDKLHHAWSKLIDPYLATSTLNYIQKTNPKSIPFKRFAEPYYVVERGSVEEKVKYIAICLDRIDATQLTIKDVEKYVISVVRSYIYIQNYLKNSNFESWKKNSSQSSEQCIVSLAKNITLMLLTQGEKCDLYELEQWLNQNPMFLILWSEVFTNLYTFNVGKHAKLGRETKRFVIPLMEGLKPGTNYTPILDIPHVMFLNSNLPNEIQHKWRLLFSSKIMGESFSTMLGNITNNGPTLIIVEDEDGFIFAGYAPAPWSLSPLFKGDATSMLFTLNPVMRCFSASGYNDHYQYLNLNQQTMPNGLGMGGQFDYWGLWIDCEYGIGHSSESCTTYRDYMQLSKQKEFKIRNLEVFAIGDKPKNDEEDEENHGSVLDRNLEDRVILELSGKKMHSDGLREPEMDL